MLQNLKKRLILLCGITTSTILTFVIIFMSFHMISQQDKHTQELFEQNVDTFIDKIKNSNMIEYSWLTKMEEANKSIIYIEDQGQPLFYRGSFNTPAKRSTLVKYIKRKADLEGIHIKLYPNSASTIKSSIYSFKTSNSCYQGMAVIIPLSSGWRSLILVQYLPDKNRNFLMQILLYLFIDVLGCAMLFLLSSYFIGKAIKPVEENQKRQVEFIAAASHELRSPLTVVLAGVSSLKQDPTQTEQYLSHIESECNRMTRLIGDMLLIATSDAKTWTLKKEVIDMDCFLIETYDLLTPFMCANNHKLSLNLPNTPLYQVYADKERLKQLLTILIDNAVNYAESDNGIEVKAYNQKKQVFIEVIDHGKGISDMQKELVFNRFYRGDKSRTDKKHFGLGLSIAQELVKLHGGKMHIKDTEGGGATFVISLDQFIE